MKLPKDEAEVQSGYIEENSYNQNTNNNRFNQQLHQDQILSEEHDEDFDYPEMPSDQDTKQKKSEFENMRE